MRVERDWLRRLVFEVDDGRRFTQDSPILPEVWLKGGVEYCRATATRIDLLLTPHKRQTAGMLARELLDRLTAATTDIGGPTPRRPRRLLARPTWTVSVNQTTVAVSLTLRELITCVLPLTEWWLRNVKGTARADSRAAPDAMQEKTSTKVDETRRQQELLWMARIVGVLARCAAQDTREADVGREPAENDPWVTGGSLEGNLEGATNADYRTFTQIVSAIAEDRQAFDQFVREAEEIEHRVSRAPESGTRPDASSAQGESRGSVPCLWSVGLNRRGFGAIDRSVAATKGDAATRVFNIKCGDLAWAVVDSGIDADHAAFFGPPDPLKASQALDTRVVAAYDFTRLRQLLSLDSHPSTGPSAMPPDVDLEEADRQFKRMRERLRSGQSLDWAALEPLIDISPVKNSGRNPAYRPPRHDHGTHVAGILGAAAANDTRYQGMCPDIRLYDFRVLNDQGRGDEFSIIAALQFIRYLNARADQPVIHGVNLSLSLIHDFENFACGRTPICDECDRLVSSGVVVVAAAGNRGHERVITTAGEIDAYRAISITDPGNAEAVITVGATHRFEPHTYGVSYFSSRGPTGDGRVKPDVLGPGERIYSTLPGNTYGAKDGTSMAAPHVSGVAALLIARHREFVGHPARVKKIICSTATDLGRERYFQGSGMVDALRALQSA